MGSRAQKIAFLVFTLMFVAVMAILNTSVLTMGTSANAELMSTVKNTDASLSIYDQNKVFGSTVIDCAKAPDEVGGTIEHAFVVTAGNHDGKDYSGSTVYTASASSDPDQVNRTAKFDSYLCYNKNSICTGVLFVQDGVDVGVDDLSMLGDAKIVTVAGMGSIGGTGGAGGGGPTLTYMPLNTGDAGGVYYDAANEAGWTDNGATYKFYDDSKNEIPYTGNISDLKDAKFYTVEGTPTKDRFYMWGPNSGSTKLYWNYYDGSAWKYENLGISIDMDETAVGTGKTNTAIVMAKDNGAYIKSASQMGKSYDTIWYYLKQQNDTNAGGYDDWFIPSAKELELCSDASTSFTWSSSAGERSPSTRSMFWDNLSSIPDSSNRNGTFSALLVRAL